MNFEPLRVSLLESEEVAGLAGVISAVHVGVEENGEMWWKLQLVQGEDVVTIGGRCQGRGGECEGGRTEKGDLLDLVVSEECLPRSCDCGAEIAESCVLLHGCDGREGGGGWLNVCAVGWWYGAIVDSVW